MKKKVCFVVGIIWGIISVFLIIATLTGQINIYGIDGWIFWIAIIMLPAISSALLVYIDNTPHTHYYTNALTGEDVQKICPDKNSFPRHMKIFAAVIIVIVVGAAVGGFKAYNQGHLDGYQDGYSKAESESNEEAYANTLNSITQQVSLYEGYLTTLLDNAVFVTEHGEKYHRFGCHYIIDSDKFWIYNSENAKAQGYDACSYCFGKDAQTFLIEDLN